MRTAGECATGSGAQAWLAGACIRPEGEKSFSECLTDTNHHDACASVRIKKTRFTIAWDDTKTISYLFTDDHSLLTDSELGVGGSCSVIDEEGKPDELVRYMDWLVTPKWMDTAGYLSGNAVWYAAIHRDAADPQNGTVVGFVQSRYLTLSK